MNSLKNKVAIVTGASSGIGHAIARIFAEAGASVVVSARRKSELDNLVEHIELNGGAAIAVCGDVTDEEHMQALVQTALTKFGALHIACNNAATMGEIKPLIETSRESWETVINTNLTSAFLGAKYQIPAMLNNGGSIIFTSSFVGNTIGFPGMAAYAASKAGLIGLTQVLAAEYGGKNIRVNSLLPGATDTPMSKEFANTPEVIEFVKNLYALKRIASPEEIAHSALYLASDASSFTTGTALFVDGGVSINRT